MINELKDESLCRDLDISFEFPDELNGSSDKIPSLPSLNGTKKVLSTEDFMPKPAFNRKQFEDTITGPTKKESIFPDFPRPKTATQQDFDFKTKEK